VLTWLFNFPLRPILAARMAESAKQPEVAEPHIEPVNSRGDQPMDERQNESPNMALVITGGVIVFCLLAFVSKFEVFGMVCYHFGSSIDLNTTCIHPALYYLSWIVGLGLIAAGAWPFVRGQLRQR
jgi:hypothetical protein